MSVSRMPHISLSNGPYHLQQQMTSFSRSKICWTNLHKIMVLLCYFQIYKTFVKVFELVCHSFLKMIWPIYTIHRKVKYLSYSYKHRLTYNQSTNMLKNMTQACLQQTTVFYTIQQYSIIRALYLKDRVMVDLIFDWSICSKIIQMLCFILS